MYVCMYRQRERAGRGGVGCDAGGGGGAGGADGGGAAGRGVARADRGPPPVARAQRKAAGRGGAGGGGGGRVPGAQRVVPDAARYEVPAPRSVPLQQIAGSLLLRRNGGPFARHNALMRDSDRDSDRLTTWHTPPQTLDGKEATDSERLR